MNIDFKELGNSRGYRELKSAVLQDIEKEKRRCEINGWTSGRDTKFNPMGGTGRFSDKFKWVIDRAKHYSYKTGIPIVEILNAWEDNRDYWYMNYYQESRQPRINGSDVLVIDTMEEFKSFAVSGFRCPRCGGVSSSPYECDSELKVQGTKSGICNWKAYGLLGCLGKGVYVFVKEKARGERIFKPICFEDQHGNTFIAATDR